MPPAWDSADARNLHGLLPTYVRVTQVTSSLSTGEADSSLDGEREGRPWNDALSQHQLPDCL